MKRNFLLLAMMIFGFGSVCAAFVVSGPVAHAYAIPSQGQLPVPSESSYSATGSFSNLVSPFTNFFNSLQTNTLPPMTLDMGVTGSSTISVGINLQYYIYQWINDIDAWFYHLSGIHIAWFLFLIVNFFYWLFHFLDGVVYWIAGLFR